jgi:hypothetical protein
VEAAVALVADKRGQARRPRVRLGLLVRAHHSVHLGAHVRDLPECAVGDAEREVVAGCFELG